MEKLYCYVDETGQDTKGRLFIVAVVVTRDDRVELAELCEEAEVVSGKGKFKWGKARADFRLAYLRRVFADRRFREALRYSSFPGTTDYDLATVDAIAKALRWRAPEEYAANVLVDGLSKTKRTEYARELRRLGLRIRKVRGVARDENSSLTRLADAVAGFVRDASEEGPPEVRDLLASAKRKRIIRRL